MENVKYYKFISNVYQEDIYTYTFDRIYDFKIKLKIGDIIKIEKSGKNGFLYLNDEKIGRIDGYNVILIFDKFSIYSDNEYCRRFLGDELVIHFFQDITKQIIREKKIKQIL